VLEGFISTFGDNPQDVRVMRICKYHADDEMQKKKNKSMLALHVRVHEKTL
jgi:hypothetical protein